LAFAASIAATNIPSSKFMKKSFSTLARFIAAGSRLIAVSKFVAAEVTRRMSACFPRIPPPHVGGYARIGILKSLLGSIAVSVAVGATTTRAANEERVEQLLGQMTLEEKIGQMTQVDSNALKDKSHIQKYAIGSVLSGG